VRPRGRGGPPVPRARPLLAGLLGAALQGCLCGFCAPNRACEGAGFWTGFRECWSELVEATRGRCSRPERHASNRVGGSAMVCSAEAPRARHGGRVQRLERPGAEEQVRGGGRQPSYAMELAFRNTPSGPLGGDGVEQRRGGRAEGNRRTRGPSGGPLPAPLSVRGGRNTHDPSSAPGSAEGSRGAGSHSPAHPAG